MIERVVENWLTDSTERSFQVPFCHVLANKGFTVLHMSRHCGMELGKDVIAIDPSGIPCAFQLKTPQGKRITLKEWRKGINQQVHDLVTLKLVHPSLPAKSHHRSFLVTNRGIDEEVARAIDDMNRQWTDSGQTHLRLETIVGGAILKDALDLGSNLWPTELSDARTLLELFLHDGAEHLPKRKLAKLLEGTMSLAEDGRKPSQADAVRSLSSAALLCAIATKAFAERENHFAQVEAWVMLIAHVLAVAERRHLPFSVWKGAFGIGVKAIRNSLANLVEELKSRPHVVEGDRTTDADVRRVRVTCLLALVAIHELWNGGEEEFVRQFCEKYQSQLLLWGESAVPQFLAFYWHLRNVDATPRSDFLLAHLIEGICRNNAPGAVVSEAIASPYYCADEVLAQRLSAADEPWEEDFRRNSYSLEAIIHLFVRQNWKQHMKQLWPSVTRVWFNRCDVKSKWRWFLWATEKADHWAVCPRLTRKWDDLRDEAWEDKGKSIPSTIKKWPLLVLLFLIVYPHRLNADVVRWLDSRFRNGSASTLIVDES